MPYSPKPPFLGWPQQWSFSAGYAWFTPTGSVLVTQLLCESVDGPMVHELHDVLDELQRQDVLKYFPKFSVLHDWRTLRRVPREARQAWGERTRRPGMPFKHTQVYIAVGSNPITRMALQSAALTVQLAVGQTPARILSDPHQVLDRLNIAPPSPEFLSRWRMTPEAAAEGATHREW